MRVDSRLKKRYTDGEQLRELTVQSDDYRNFLEMDEQLFQCLVKIEYTTNKKAKYGDERSLITDRFDIFVLHCCNDHPLRIVR